jgi:8-oxo-dGTP diphosphatase
MTKISHDSETAAHGKQVFTACAFIHHTFDGVTKVFLAKRAATKKFLPGVHELPGGHIDFGEDLVAGLKREINEEFEKNIRVGDPFAVFTYTNPIKQSHSIEVVYFAEFEESIEDVVLHPEDHESYGWFAENELDQLATTGKAADDDEYIAIQKGFTLLRGELPIF